MNFNDTDTQFMALAIEEATLAFQRDEVPVGAVITLGGEVLARAGNCTEQRKDATAHAEIIAIQAAMKAVNEKRLAEATIYVTLEPCPMCAGAIVLARLKRIVFACSDPKSGACTTLYNIASDPKLNHRCIVEYGLLADDSAELLRSFFRNKRVPKA